MTYDLCIRGGQIVTSEGVFRADVGVRDGRIVAIAEGLDGTTSETVDATGLLVLPGGVDSHVHIDQPSNGPTEMCDDFDSASASAVAGGTTSVICFVWQTPGASLAEIAADYAERAKASRVDYAFHLTITDPTPEVLEVELPALVAAGNSSVKVFMTYTGVGLKDGQLLDVLEAARRSRALVCVHAENHALIEFLTEKLIEGGLSSPKYFPLAKPMLAEREAVHRIITFSEALDVPIHIFHVSGAESAAEIERAQARGVKVTAETCPHYLTFTSDDLDRPGFEGAKYVFGPPARTLADQDALWSYLKRGVISVISSDHSPSRYDDPKGKKVGGENAPFSMIPNGIPGLAARLPVFYSEGVAKGRISVEMFVDLVSTRPAKMFGLFPKKGTIAVGSDADLVLWDPEMLRVLTTAGMHHGSDYTPYEGMQVKGSPLMTFLRGRCVYNAGEPVGLSGGGLHLPRPRHTAPLLDERAWSRLKPETAA